MIPLCSMWDDVPPPFVSAGVIVFGGNVFVHLKLFSTVEHNQYKNVCAIIMGTACYYMAPNYDLAQPRQSGRSAIRTPRQSRHGFSGTQPRESNGKNEEKDQKWSSERTSTESNVLPDSAQGACFEPATVHFKAQTWSTTLLMVLIISWILTM